MLVTYLQIEVNIPNNISINVAANYSFKLITSDTVPEIVHANIVVSNTGTQNFSHVHLLELHY